VGTTHPPEKEPALHPWIAARLLEQRRKNHPIGEARPGPRQGRSGRRSRWFDRVVPAGARPARRRAGRPAV